MYFSMQDVKQVSSPFEREVPGFGTQRSKQCSLSFYKDIRKDCASMRQVRVYLDKHARILHGSLLLHLLHDLALGVVGESRHSA